MWDWDAEQRQAPKPPPQRRSTGSVVAFTLVGCLLLGLVGILGLTAVAQRLLPDHTDADIDRAAAELSLRELMIAAPEGSHPWPTRPAEATLDARMVAANGGDPTKYGFSGGYLRRWIGSDGVVVEIRLERFDSEQHARGYRWTTLAATELLNWGTPTAVADTDANAATWVNPEPGQDGYTTTLSIGVLDDLNIVISAALPPAKKPGPEVADSLMAAEALQIGSH